MPVLPAKRRAQFEPDLVPQPARRVLLRRQQLDHLLMLAQHGVQLRQPQRQGRLVLRLLVLVDAFVQLDFLLHLLAVVMGGIVIHQAVQFVGQLVEIAVALLHQRRQQRRRAQGVRGRMEG